MVQQQLLEAEYQQNTKVFMDVVLYIATLLAHIQSISTEQLHIFLFLCVEYWAENVLKDYDDITVKW